MRCASGENAYHLIREAGAQPLGGVVGAGKVGGRHPARDELASG